MRDRWHTLAAWATVKGRYLIAACAVLITILVGIAAAPLAMNRFTGEHAATSSLGINGHFTLMTPDGSAVTGQSFRGKWLVIYFGYTLCPDLCRPR
jgi:cytochrome oxidase Cu insertion factor (SCO1/SenC/PrrC family)